MKKKKILIISIISILILLAACFIGRKIYDKVTLTYVGNFLDNQDRITKIKIYYGDGHHGEITDKELITDIMDSLSEIQVRKSSEIKGRLGWWFHIYCYDENNEEIFTLLNRHPWYIKGNLAEGYYTIVTYDEFKQIYEPLYQYTRPSDEP